MALACIVSIALQAPAAEPSDRERAQQLNDEGSAAMDTHHYGEALDLFQRAARIYPSPKLSFNVGLALLKLGRKVEALAALESYLADVQDAPAEKRRFAGAQVDLLRREIGQLVMTCNVIGALVLVDGTPASTTPLLRPLRVPPGEHVLRVQANGHESHTQTLTVAPGETVRTSVTLSPSPSPVVDRRPPAPKPLIRRPWFWGAIAGAAVVTGTVLGVSIVYGGAERSPTPSLGTIR